MNRQEYKQQYNAQHYEKLTLSLPVGTKQTIKDLAADRGQSTTAYIIDLVQQQQNAMYDAMQLPAKSREKLQTITGNTTEGYTVRLKDGQTFHCHKKNEVRGKLAKIQLIK